MTIVYLFFAGGILFCIAMLFGGIVELRNYIKKKKGSSKAKIQHSNPGLDLEIEGSVLTDEERLEVCKKLYEERHLSDYEYKERLNFIEV